MSGLYRNKLSFRLVFESHQTEHIRQDSNKNILTLFFLCLTISENRKNPILIFENGFQMEDYLTWI